MAIQHTNILRPPDIHLTVVVSQVMEPLSIHCKKPPSNGGGHNRLDGTLASMEFMWWYTVPLEVQGGVKSPPHSGTGNTVQHGFLVDDINDRGGNNSAILGKKRSKYTHFSIFHHFLLEINIITFITPFMLAMLILHYAYVFDSAEEWFKPTCHHFAVTV